MLFGETACFIHPLFVSPLLFVCRPSCHNGHALYELPFTSPRTVWEPIARFRRTRLLSSRARPVPSRSDGRMHSNYVISLSTSLGKRCRYERQIGRPCSYLSQLLGKRRRSVRTAARRSPLTPQKASNIKSLDHPAAPLTPLGTQTGEI